MVYFIGVAIGALIIYFVKTLDEWEKTYQVVNDIIDDIECTMWYHVDKDGALSRGANPPDIVALYKVEDIDKVLDKYK